MNLPGRRSLAALAAALLFLWLLLPLAPEEWGLRLGVPHRFILTLLALAVLLFFVMAGNLMAGGTRPRGSPLAGIAIAFAVAVGLPVAIGVSYPQFEVPRPAAAQEIASPAERGKSLFQNPAVGCFACHSISSEGIRGGQRGPELSGVGDRAATRVPGTAAGDYIAEHIKRGSDPSLFTVPGYPPIMPPFGQRLKKEEVDDLAAFLLSLKGNATK